MSAYKFKNTLLLPRMVVIEMKQDPTALPSPCPQPTFCLWKNFSQRMSLIVEKWEMQKQKKCSQTGQNNNSLVTKQSQWP